MMKETGPTRQIGRKFVRAIAAPVSWFAKLAAFDSGIILKMSFSKFVMWLMDERFSELPPAFVANWIVQCQKE